jgi:polysaccharide deacetylase family protein (PEP-CTERM system associated)
LTNALTIDVEDYFHVTGFEALVSRSDWGSFPCRVVANTQRVLDILDRFGVRATFFVLGWVAERFPRLVAEIHARGHELGSHTFWHRLIYEQSPAEFRADLRRSCAVIEDIAGTPVRSFRAPSFSITRESLWALEILAEEGITADSSIFPVWHDRYGIPDASLEPHLVDTPSGPIWEFPPAVLRVGRVPVPVAGGGYFRLFPYRFTARVLAMINRSRPFVFYIHPWEIDPGQPRLRGGTRYSRWRHYQRLSSAETKFERLLGGFQFSTLRSLMALPGGTSDTGGGP